MATRQLNLELLEEFPWIMSVPSHPRIISNDSPYTLLLEMAQERIVAEERHQLETAAPGSSLTMPATVELDHMLIPGHALLQSLLSNHQNPIPVQKVSQLTAWLLRYRLFDVLDSISSPERPTTQAGQPFKYPIPDPGRIGYKAMGNWPKALKEALNKIQTTSYFDDDRTPDGGRQPEMAQGNVTTQLCNSLTSRLLETEGHFVVCNFECAALYLNILHQLQDFNADLPPCAEDFRWFLRSNMPSIEWESLFEKLHKTQTFKLPLQMALAVSPLCLFLPTQLMFRDVNRLQLLLMWQGLGGPRPENLAVVESKIFRALADVAIGSSLPRPRFTALFRELLAMDFSRVTYTESSWLASDPKFSSRVSPEYFAPTHPSEIPISIPFIYPPSSQATMFDDPVFHYQPANMEARFPIRSSETGGQLPSVDGALPDPRVTTKSVSQDAPLQRPKRGKGFTVVHQAVDLSAEREVILVHEITSLAPGVQTYRAATRCTGGPPPACCFSPRFCTLAERAMFERLWNLGTNPVPGHTPPSQITTASRQSIEAWTIPQLQSAVRLRDVVITDIPGLSNSHSRFDEPSLKTLASLQRIIVAKDFSLPPGEQRVHILMKTLLDAATASDPKIIRSDYFPVSDVPIFAPRGIASDIMAWDATINRPWCRDLHEFPRDTMRFAVVSTSSAYEDCHVPVHGFGVYFEVQAGSILLFIGRNGQRGPLTSADRVHLVAGSGMALRPGTPFYWLTTENAIVKGSYWYASSNLVATATSIIHDFIAPDSPSSATDKSARLVLRRLVHFYHMVYTSGLYFSARDSDECAHTPDVATMEGLENLLSLCNLMELANVLAGDDYTRDGIPEPERQEIIEARRLCRKMVDWVRRHFIILDPQTQQEKSPNDDVWMPFLARYVKLLRESKLDQAKSRLAHSSEAQSIVAVINESISSNAVLQAHLCSPDISSGPDPLVFPGFSTLEITLRSDILPEDDGDVGFLPPDSKLLTQSLVDQIVGENASDEKHHRVLRSLSTT